MELADERDGRFVDKIFFFTQMLDSGQGYTAQELRWCSVLVMCTPLEGLGGNASW